MKPVIISALMLVCIAFGIALVPACERLDKVFSSSSVPVPAALVGPGRIMRVSAYCPCEKCCGKWADGYTASGVRATGKIVAAPPTIPFGYVLSIPGYSEHAVVQDRGGAITGNRLDVLFTDKDGVSGHQRALNWGVQELMVWEVTK